jgi:hypothetical protein
MTLNPTVPRARMGEIVERSCLIGDSEYSIGIPEQPYLLPWFVSSP